MGSLIGGMLRRLCVVAAGSLALLTNVSADNQQRSSEILWDSWGVPHLYANTQEDAFYLMGWAQARAHANTLAVSLGQVRGRAAEHWGSKYASSDAMVHNLGVLERSAQWFEQERGPYRERIAAFARGMNEYVAAHPDALAAENRWVFPVEPSLIVAHNTRLIAGFLMHEADTSAIGEYISRTKQARDNAPRGSNGFAIAPKRSTNGNAMLVINPHLSWGGELTFFESHIVAPGIDAYGASLLGQPFLSLGFTPDLGWTQTVNPYDGVDTYELTLQGEGYLFDGKVRSFERLADVTLKVRGADGKVTEQVLERRRSVHGPVIYYDAAAGKALAVRISGREGERIVERFWSLLQARTMQQFEAVNQRLPLSFFNTVYADRGGHILFQYNADLPDRRVGDRQTWRGIVPGDRSEYLWSKTLPITQMPRLADPTTGFLQNSNDPPWSSTFPWELDPARYSKFLPAPAMDFRAQSITKNLLATPKLSFEELVRQRNANRVEMADRFLPDLFAAVATTDDGTAREAATVLQAWNRHVDPDSRGAVLFLQWVDAMGGPSGDWFAEPWNEKAPLTTPRGLKSPANAVQTLVKAAEEVRERYGALDVPFGDVYRMRVGDKDVPSRVASVFYGTAADGGFRRAEDGKYAISSGDTFIAVVEFSKPTRAEGILPYGNSSQPGSPHVGDQLELFSQGKLRPLWRDRRDVEEHTKLRERF
ncbi:penicillin acylase family protein [Steroidobacter sp.]|uniref:penicillin acylase family protein n=1 Tax=Steroidobacter sp. TaxID=1978227 RepID=UPI001A3CBF6C|nr:penicillin acylase family protein [Steroidobacter sp.]MBL8269850.1 penicillin acylase family protein [Steroidobacter sp.]